MYNTYAGVQLKIATELTLENYKIGQAVDIPDGIYVGHGGYIVVKDGILIMKRAHITTSWGHKVKAKILLDKYNPLLKAIKKFQKKKKEEAKKK